jgi:TrmH family RNA methyltransferase
MKHISSRDNPLFKSLRALAEDHREPRRRGEALVDGIHLVQTCVERGVELRQLVISETGALNSIIAAMAASLAQAEVDCCVLTDALFRDATGVTSPTGIAAVIAIPDAADWPLNGDALMLDAVQDAGNVGALLRTAAAAGVVDVLLGHGCAGAWTPRVLRAGQGAHFSLRIREQVDLSAAVAGYSGRTLATVAREGESLYALELNTPVAWIFGNEGAGVSTQLIDAATNRVTIPMYAATESLNVAAAAAVCLFEACRQRRLFNPTAQ